MEETETYELTISVDLPKRDMEKITSISQETLKQMCFRGIFELLFRGAYKINSLDISVEQLDERVRAL